MLVTKTVKIVTNFSKLSPTHKFSSPTFVTNIDVDRSLDPFASLMQHHPYGLKGLYGLKGQMKTVYPICLTSFHLEIFQWVHSTSAQVEQARVLLNFVVPTKHITRKTFYDDKNVCSSLSIGWFCSKTFLPHGKWYIFLERKSKSRWNPIFHKIWTCSINFCTFN